MESMRYTIEEAGKVAIPLRGKVEIRVKMNGMAKKRVAIPLRGKVEIGNIFT